MPRVLIGPDNIEQAVLWIIPYLEDTSIAAHKAIYFDGWQGLAASAVLRAIAKHPPPSLLKKFDKIVHVDCSRWKSRRALQRTIAQELKLPQRVMAIFDKQDEEDDFSGVDENSRAEIVVIKREIHRALQEHMCLVVFHNGSNNMVDLTNCGIPSPQVFDVKTLWSFRGRLRLNSEIAQEVDSSHLHLYNDYTYSPHWENLLLEEAREIACKLGVTTETVRECCLYLLSLNYHGTNIIDYNWATHASSYWVCDGIIQGGQTNEAWEIAAALHRHIHTEDYSANALPSFGDRLKTPPKRWMFVRDNSMVTMHPESTSFFLVAATRQSDSPLPPLCHAMFHQSNKLQVLKLCRCTFSFSSPPFLCCRTLRFLGLDGCKDQQAEEDENQDEPVISQFFQSLWVLDICNTNWELASSPEIIDQMSANIREVHINKGRIWSSSMAWHQLQNLRKLRVIEPTYPWETEELDAFRDMVKLELLDLSRDSTIQVLPSLSGATSLKTLVLDGCVGLKHVGPKGLPPSLESFSLDARAGVDRNNKAKIASICLAGCARLVSFRLCGSIPNLEKLDLSGTLVKTLDLKDKGLQVPVLEKIIVLGCLQLHAILWPDKGLPRLTVLHIDSAVCRAQIELHQAYVTIMDIRFFQTLVLQSHVAFCSKSTRFHLNVCVPCSSKVKEQRKKEMTGPQSSGQIMGQPQPKSLIPNTYWTYTNVCVDNMAIDDDYNRALQFQPSDFHVEIGAGISNISVESSQGIKAIIFVMDNVESLHVHDNASIATVIPEHMMPIEDERILWRHLKRCHVVRCPRMHSVFTIWYDYYCFRDLETFWASDLQMAHCIWSKGRTIGEDNVSFVKLRNIHLYSCPRLTYVLPLLRFTLRSLETLHIVNCGDLIEVFPVNEEFLTRIAIGHRKDMLEFPELKDIYLHDLYKLQRICEAKMFAPKLETVRLRECWGLKRLPAVGRDSRPIVECGKDWWEKLEWDGLEAGHHPSLFEPHHSSYYNNGHRPSLPRGSVLR